MRPSAHFNFSILFITILQWISNMDPTITYIVLFLAASVFIDFDFIIAKNIGIDNHRELLTHNIFLWIGAILLASFLNLEILFWLSLGCIFHITIDLIDYGIHLIPGIVTPHLLNVDDTFQKELDFANEYWTNYIIIGLEILLFVSAIVIIVVFGLYTNLFVVLFAIFSIFYSIREISSILKYNKLIF